MTTTTTAAAKQSDLSPEALDFVRNLVRQEAAIVLERDKAYLVEARLGPLARREGFGSIDELVTAMRAPSGRALCQKAVDAMTTNETSFFRDIKPFEVLKEHILPDVIERRRPQRSLNIWCAASSSGQEPYTVAMVLAEHFPEILDWRVTFVASDISQEMLARSRTGRYTQLEVNRGLPAPYLVRYFKRAGTEWEVDERLRRLIDFRELNLCRDWPHMPELDIVFMRNVLIYFDHPTKAAILDRLRSKMHPRAYLFLGGAESTLNIHSAYQRVAVAGTACFSLDPDHQA